MADTYILDSAAVMQRITPDDLTNPIQRRALFAALKRVSGLDKRNLAVLLDAIDSAMQGMVVCPDRTDAD